MFFIIIPFYAILYLWIDGDNFCLFLFLLLFVFFPRQYPSFTIVQILGTEGVNKDFAWFEALFIVVFIFCCIARPFQDVKQWKVLKHEGGNTNNAEKHKGVGVRLGQFPDDKWKHHEPL